jgi:glucose dehydrogenase
MASTFMLGMTLIFVGCLWGGDQWPVFLGGMHRELKADTIPTAWSLSSLAWQTKTPGHGQSSPVIYKEMVVVTAVEGAMKENLWVIALDLAAGKELWRYTMKSSDPVKSTDYVSRAAPTPVVDSKHVYAVFESGDIVALDHQGKKVWERSLAKDIGKFKNEFGLGSSPVLVDDKLIHLVDDKGPSYLIALNANDGSTAWKTDRTERQSWSSPAVVMVAGKPHVVCSSGGSVDGYDPATGKLLWSMKDVGGNTAATPVPFGDGKFLIAASQGRRGENADVAKISNAAVQVQAKPDGTFEAKKLWIAKGVSLSWASPIVHEGHAYWINTVGALWCIDAQTGTEVYSERLGDSCWATPIGVGKTIYFFGRNGGTTIIAAGPKFEKIRSNKLWEPAPAAEKGKKGPGGPGNFSTILYGVAAVDGAIVMRNGDTVFCVRKS